MCFGDYTCGDWAFSGNRHRFRGYSSFQSSIHGLQFRRLALDLCPYCLLGQWGLFLVIRIWALRDVPVKSSFRSSLLLFYHRGFNKQKGFFEKCWAMMASFLSSTYIFPPQFSLFLLPLFTLVPAVSLPLFYILDLANVSIIILWFNQYGVYPAGPMDPASPVQWIASFRQLLLMFLLIKFLFQRPLKESLGPDGLKTW